MLIVQKIGNCIVSGRSLIKLKKEIVNISRGSV